MDGTTAGHGITAIKVEKVSMSRLYIYKPLNLILAVLNSFLDFKIHFADEQKGFLCFWSFQWKGGSFLIFMHKVFDSFDTLNISLYLCLKHPFSLLYST